MRALRYLMAIDESFNASDYGRTRRFLREVLDIAPAANIGCVMRQTRLVPFAPGTADGMLMSSVGLSVVSTYFHLGFTENSAENSGHRDAIWSESSGVMLSFEDVWDRFRRLLESSSLQSRCHGDGMSEVTRMYDAIVCVRPAQDEATAQPEDLRIHQVARWAKLPVWLCPLHFVAIDRVVIAVAGRQDDDRLLVTGQTLARALNASFAIACCGCDTFNQRVKSIAPWAQWSIVSCSCADDLLFSLNPRDLLVVMGASGSSPLSRLFATSHTEKIIDGLQNPALILPHSQSWWPFGANRVPQCSAHAYSIPAFVNGRSSRDR